MPSFSPCFFLLPFLFPLFFLFLFFPPSSFPLPLPFDIFLLLLAFCLLPSSFCCLLFCFQTSVINFTVFSAHQKGEPHWATQFFHSNGQHIFLIIHEDMHKHNMKKIKSICVSYYNSWANVDRFEVSIPVLLRTSREDDINAVQRQTRYT